MTGKIMSVGSKPSRHFTLQPPTVPPAPPPDPIVFNEGVDADDFAAACAAYAKGSDADVSGTAPACTGVTAK